MTGVSQALILFLGVLATLAGCALSQCLPWSERARTAAVPLAAGLALGPLLAGLAAVAALAVLPRFAHSHHLLAVCLVLSLGAALGWRRLGRGMTFRLWPEHNFGRVALFIIAGFVLALAVDTATVPLIQNDALEYAIVGRDLFHARDISAYPALHPAGSASGFFGPWTHPPLYVALIYLGFAAAGDAESAWALRAIAPWCLVTTTLVVLALGRMHHSRSGWVAAMVFISTPLLFLGSASALIDPLPVLGFTLVLAGLVGFSGRIAAVGAGLGLLLGLSLWTHSQAVLFPFLALPALWFVSGHGGALAQWRAAQDWRRWALTASLSLLVAALIAAVPYLRNLSIYGSPISDNPVVFALPSLQWAEYFRMQRGIGSFAEVVQYGVFKGFFAVEAYSFAFWFALAGLMVTLRPVAGLQDGIRQPTGAGGTGLARVALAIWVLYVVATAASAALGVDLMIRNERYLLVLIPCVALLAGMGVAAMTSWRSPAGLLTLLVFSLASAQLVTLVAYRQGQLRGSTAATDLARQLDRWPPYASVKFLAQDTPASAVALTMKPADMFYARRRMISYLDPRMLPFYAARGDVAGAAAQLQALGVTHVHLPDYFLPPLYMSALMDLVAQPGWTVLQEDAGGYQIYALRETAASTVAKSVPASGGWSRQSQLILGGRKALKRIVLSEGEYTPGTESLNVGVGGFFGRETGQSLRSAPFDLKSTRSQCGSGSLSGSEVRVELRFRGRAHVQLLATLDDGQGAVSQRRLLGDRPTLEGDALTVIQRRFRVAPEVASMQLLVEHSGISRVVLESAQVEILCDSSAR